ncbi:MAG: SpoIVB peptidase [Clostridia bacterium]|nr:SpoIVB peptidase [Clostridia bacterium]
MFCVVSYYNNILPSNVVIYDDESIHFNTKIKITSKNQQKINNVSNLRQKQEQNYTTNLLALGVIPVKSVNIKVVNRRYVTLSGEPFGIKIFTKGVMVVGLSNVKTGVGNINPAKEIGINVGDIILSANQKKVNSNEEFSKIINISNGNPVFLKIKREDKILNLKLTPVKELDSGDFKAGLWVRDSSAGLGTMTFYSSVNGRFAGLGHAIVDVDTGVLLPINSGEIVKTKILSVNKSKPGAAGEICGVFTGERLGELVKNTDCGLYGFYDNYETSKNMILVANKQDVKTGNAKIYTTLDKNGPKFYDCVIERIDYNDSAHRNLLVRVTDEKLIKRAGGIVQGMSGSPIVQNGQLVGALTNVFLNEPEKGYAVFADTMLEISQKTIKAS